MTLNWQVNGYVVSGSSSSKYYIILNSGSHYTSDSGWFIPNTIHAMLIDLRLLVPEDINIWINAVSDSKYYIIFAMNHTNRFTN